MIKLPEKHSLKWLYTAAAILVLTLILLITFARISGIILGTQNMIGFVILSFMISAALNLGGFLGAKIYLSTSVLFYIIAAGYMFYIAVSETAKGWTDLVGIISYIFIVTAGIMIGIVLQVIIFITLKINKKK